MRTNAKVVGKRCQCPACKEIFSTESNFDKHRRGEHGMNRHCVPTESVGLVIAETSTGLVWRGPSRFMGDDE